MLAEMTEIYDVSIVVPVYNESANLRRVVDDIESVFSDRTASWEIVFVNDGSTDDSWEIIRDLCAEDSRVKDAGYATNAGRGRALRAGFDVACGEIVVSVDADLSYRAEHILDLVEALETDPDMDFVLGSAYMPGGGTENVPLQRLLISRFGNKILQWTVNRQIYTFTCVFRAYRRKVLRALDLEGDGKEIHLEILSRALNAGFRMKEVPVTLRGRKKGKSKFRFRGTAVSHLFFSFSERPILFFGAAGLFLFGLGILGGAYVTVCRFRHTLTEGRPLTVLVVLLVLGGMQLLSFGFIAVQIGALRREMIKLQRSIRLTDQDSAMSEKVASGDASGNQ